MNLICVGSVGLDGVETPQEKRSDLLGGSASYFATVASLVGEVGVVAVVGTDFPEQHLDFLRERRVDLNGLQRVDGRTFRWSGRYLENMVDRETISTELNVFEHFSPELPSDYRKAEYVFLANIDPNLQLNVLRQVERPKFVAIDTMNFWLGPSHVEVVKEVLRSSNLVVLNDEEARLLSGQHNLVKAAAAVRLIGVDRVIIKRGDAGAMLFDDHGPFWAPAFPLHDVIDPTGAGDSFAGGLMAYLAKTDDLSDESIRRGMIFASAAASYVVEDFSVDRYRSLSRDELLHRCDDIGRLVRFQRISL